MIGNYQERDGSRPMNELHRNDGLGGFSKILGVSVGITNGRTVAVAFGDADGNGALCVAAQL